MERSDTLQTRKLGCGKFIYLIIIDYNMQELFKAKVRKVGTSLGVLIPGLSLIHI